MLTHHIGESALFSSRGIIHFFHSLLRYSNCEVARISKVVDSEMIWEEFRAVKEELRCGEFLK